MVAVRAPLTGTPRSDGRWQIVVTLTRGDGAKIRKTLYGPSQGSVQEKARKLLYGEGREAKSPYLISDLVEFAKSDRWKSVKPSTLKTYTWASDRILERFGKEEVAKLRSPAVARWLKSLAETPGISGRSVQIHKMTLHALYALAVEIGWAGSNPVRDVRLPCSAKPREQRRLTHPDWWDLIGWEPNPVLRDLWILLGETGLRPSEALALRKADLFDADGAWWIRVGESKTAAGAGREIPIADDLAGRLRERDDYLFPSGTGKPLMYRNVVRSWKKALDDNGIPATNLYQLRKFRLSSWIAAGVPDDVVKVLAGHEKIEMTKNIYNRVGRERIAEALGRKA